MNLENKLKRLNDLTQEAQKLVKRSGASVIPTIVTVGLATAISYLAWNTFSQQAQLEAFDRQVQQVTDIEKRLTLEKDRLTLENAVNATRAQVIGGILVFFTAFTAWRNLKVAEEKQVTERFSKAVEQLGHDKIDVRLGAIYSLERIANDSDKDYWQVIEILTAYVRGRSPWTPDKEKQNLEELPLLPIDIQAVLTVLTRRKHFFGNGEEEILDLHRTDLRKANLRGIHLEGAVLLGAHLEKAYLLGAYLEEAFLVTTHLEGATLEGASLEGMEKANLEGTDLKGVNLKDANLNGVNLEGVRNLTHEQLASAITDKNTKRPDYLQPRTKPS